MRHRSVLILAGLLSATGCYHYQAYSPQEVGVGQAVRLRLTADEAAKYSDLRLSDPRLVEGKVVDRSATGFMLDATVGVNSAQVGTRALTQRLSIPTSGVIDVELKTLDRTKTSLVVGSAAAVGVVALLKAGGAFGGSDTPGTDNPEARRIPILRLRLPF